MSPGDLLADQCPRWHQAAPSCLQVPESGAESGHGQEGLGSPPKACTTVMNLGSGWGFFSSKAQMSRGRGSSRSREKWLLQKVTTPARDFRAAGTQGQRAVALSKARAVCVGKLRAGDDGRKQRSPGDAAGPEPRMKEPNQDGSFSASSLLSLLQEPENPDLPETLRSLRGVLVRKLQLGPRPFVPLFVPPHTPGDGPALPTFHPAARSGLSRPGGREHSPTPPTEAAPGGPRGRACRGPSLSRQRPWSPAGFPCCRLTVPGEGGQSHVPVDTEGQAWGRPFAFSGHGFMERPRGATAK